jgi:hypothetical protein
MYLYIYTCIYIPGYAVELLKELVDGYAHSPGQVRNSINELRESVPDHLSSTAVRPNKVEAVAAFITRYNHLEE